MLDSLRSDVRRMAGYVPGEQVHSPGLLKLNTNENPYPPSPRVLEAIRAAATGETLRRYPEPMGDRFRAVTGRVLNVDPDSILIGNGSDDILTILTRAFVPAGGLIASLTPSYTLYRSLAEIQGARFVAVPFTADWGIPDPWPAKANLTFLPNPNSPTGTMVPRNDLIRLADDGPLVIDEAYVEFAETNALDLTRTHPNVIVTRTFSKFFALAGLRFGFAVARPEVVRELAKVKDSYNCDALSLAGAAAALEDAEYYAGLRAKILASRGRLAEGLANLGFVVTPSQANFVWCRWEGRELRPIYESLKARDVLIRFMRYDGYGEGLRISVGTDADVDRVLAELKLPL